MLKQKNTSPEASILERFNDPQDFTVARMQRTLVKTLCNSAQNKSSTLNEQDYYNIEELSSILQEIELWQESFHDKSKMLDELYKAGITLVELTELWDFICHKVVPRKDFHFVGIIKKIGLLINK